MRQCSLLPVFTSQTCVRPALSHGRRFLEYWAIGVSGRTQPFAQGDLLPRLDNTRQAIHQSSAAAASLTGNPNGIAYDQTNIFSVEGYSPLEKQHYVPLRGIDKHRLYPALIRAKEAAATAALMRELQQLKPPAPDALETRWWGRVLKDFPSLQKPCTETFKQTWENFYLEVLACAHDGAAVHALAVPFVRTQTQVEFISPPLIWRLAERLADALEGAAVASRYEQRIARVVVEEVTKRMLDTLADEPWAHQDSTNPLFVDVSSVRAWHEAGLW